MTKRMNDINAFQVADNDVYLAGTDENGKNFTIVFDAYNFQEWITESNIEYIKEKIIENLNLKK
jgi:hypothetical protein